MCPMTFCPTHERLKNYCSMGVVNVILVTCLLGLILYIVIPISIYIVPTKRGHSIHALPSFRTFVDVQDRDVGRMVYVKIIGRECRWIIVPTAKVDSNNFTIWWTVVFPIVVLSSYTIRDKGNDIERIKSH